MTCAVKICGLMTTEAVDAAVEAGADMVGFVFFPPSPRSVTLDTATALAKRVPDRVMRVALTVDADDWLLNAITTQVRPDIMQLHGHENSERVAAVRKLCGIPVMKAVAISAPGDLDHACDYAKVADQLMFDAKPPRGASRPGGNAVMFDWSLIANKKWCVPWILAGGLTSGNVVEAIEVTKAPTVDVSSGVENDSGVKDPEMIWEFINVVKSMSLRGV